MHDLPYQLVDGIRLVHLGNGAGMAGASVRLCRTTAPVHGFRFKVRDGHVTLDCDGVRFDGSIRGGSISRALDVDRSTPGIAHVAIRNCGFANYAAGLVLTGPNVAEESTERALSDFRITNVVVSRSGGAGIYVGPHSRRFTIDQCTISDSTTTGIYIDANSSDVTVRRSLVSNNGHSGCSLGREGIAIDASSNHRIEENILENNRYAAIALYKNCGESETPRPWPVRNVEIRANVFRGHTHPDGAAVMVAARQGLSSREHDCFRTMCTDPTTDSGEQFDDVRRVSILGNLFRNNLRDIVILSGDQVVANNWFVDPMGDGPRIIVGSDFLVRHPRPHGPVTLGRNINLGPTETIGHRGGIDLLVTRYPTTTIAPLH